MTVFDMLTIHSIINRPLPSQTYVAHREDQIHCLVVDPGTPDNDALMEYIQIHQLKICAVLLTHEHFDHCAGVNMLYNFQPFELICTQKCAENIRSSKQNYSRYHDEVDDFEIDIPATIAVDNEPLAREGFKFTFIETPGHSPGSACVFFENFVFTGDTVLNGIKSPLTFTHSNRNHYYESIQKLGKHLKPGQIIYPGHGESFEFVSLDQIT